MEVFTLLGFSFTGIKRYFCKYLAAFVMILWTIGLLAGYWFGFKTPVSVVSLMRVSFYEGSSIVWRLCVLLLPMILAVSFPCYCLPLICFCKAFALGFCLYCIGFAFGTAGWLICSLCLFSDVCSAAILLWFAFYNTNLKEKHAVRKFVCCFFVIIALGLFDCFALSPFTVMLLNY